MKLYKFRTASPELPALLGMALAETHAVIILFRFFCILPLNLQMMSYLRADHYFFLDFSFATVI